MSTQSPLLRSVTNSPTDFWCDSCSIPHVVYALESGAVGSTCNPLRVTQVLAEDYLHSHGWIEALAASHPTWSEIEVTRKVTEKVALQVAEQLQHVFKTSKERLGRVAVPVDPTLYRNAGAMVEQALELNALAENVQVSIPATKAGITSIEEATYLGINVCATHCASVSQAVAVAQAVERGLERREAAGQTFASMTPLCTFALGDLEDWLKAVANRDDIIASPGFIDWAGVACFKHTYRVYQDMGYRTHLMATAFRHHLHWTELIGGHVLLSIPHRWQKRFNRSKIEVRPRFDKAVSKAVIHQLETLFYHFGEAYDQRAITPDQFDSFAVLRRMLRTTISSHHNLIGVVRDAMLPNPDLETTITAERIRISSESPFPHQ